MNSKKLKKFMLFLCLSVSIIGLMVYFAGFIKRYSNEEFNKQLIGNLFITNFNIISNYIQGFLYSTPYSLEIRIAEKSLNKFDKIIDSLNSYKIILSRFLYYLGKEQSFTHINMPNIKYENAEMFFAKKKHNAKIKLTGGLLDHFDTKKYSIRIKLKNDTLLNMTKFNLYNPKVREGGIYEWVGHMLMKNAGLIYLQTGYLNVKINNDYKGTYFYQEAPSKQMLKNNKKPFGLLFKLQEKSGRWIITDIYDEDEVEDSLIFKSQILHVKTLVDKLNYNEIKFTEIFSNEKMARYYAVLDLVNGVHSAHFENCYFYFNPIDSLIEPIGKEFATNFIESAFPLKVSNLEKPVIAYGHRTFNSLVDSSFINNEIFINEYKQYVKLLSDSICLANLFSDFSKELNNRQMNLFFSNPYFAEFSKEHYFKNQRKIRMYNSN